jgi:hypothetical protein
VFRGQFQTALSWLNSLPDAVVFANPALNIYYAGTLMYINQLEAAEIRLQEAELGVRAGGVSLIYRIVLGVGVLAAVLTVGALLYSVVAWKNSYWGIAARVHYTLVTVAAVAFVWFLNYWNLLGWRF